MSNMHYSGSDIRHSTLYSYTTKQDKKQFYTTVSDDEVIDFSEIFTENTHSNFLWIESVDSDLYISLNNSDALIYIPSGHAREISYLDIVKMQVCCPVGTKLRYYIQTF